MGLICKTSHQPAVHRSRVLPRQPGDMWFGNTLGRAGATRRADVPPGRRDPAPENVPCRVDIAVRHQTAAAAGKLAHMERHGRCPQAWQSVLA